MSKPINIDFLRALQSAAPGASQAEISETAGIARNNFARTLKAARAQGLVSHDSHALTQAGLDAVGASRAHSSDIELVAYRAIERCALNPRKTFDEDALAELADAIHGQGLLQNLVVRPKPGAQGVFQIIAGERRWRAIGKLIADGRAPADYPVRCLIKPMSDAELIEAAIVENQARADVPAIEEAEAYLALSRALEAETGSDKGLTREVAERIGKTQRFVQDRIKIARDLHPRLKAKMSEPGSWLGAGLARILSRYDKATQLDALKSLDQSSHFRTEDGIKRWLEFSSYPATRARFELELYTAKGAGLTRAEDGTPDRLTNKPLFEKLQRDWAEAEVERLAKHHGYGGTKVGGHHDLTGWRKPPRGTPKDQLYAIARIGWDFAVHIEHGVVSDKTAARLEKTAKLEGAPEIPARAWEQGAVVRTAIARKLVAQDPLMAMALTVTALMDHMPLGDWREPDSGTPDERYSHMSGPLMAVRRERQTGDTGKALERIPSELGSIVLAGQPGFSEDGRQLRDRRAAVRTLLRLQPGALQRIFAAVVADTLEDTSWLRGSRADAIAVAEENEGAPELGVRKGLTAEWLEPYKRPAIEALAWATGARAAMGAAGVMTASRKGDFAQQVAAHADADFIPVEMRFDTADALAAEAAALMASRSDLERDTASEGA